MKVCYWGTYDRDYPRNRILISGLRENGVEVVECNAGIWRNTAEKMAAATSSWANFKVLSRWFKAYVDLAWRFKGIKNVDFMIIGYSGHFDVFVARILSRVKGVPIVFDAFLSLYDSLVFDRKVVRKGSLKAGLLYYVDKYSCKLADMVLLDTDQHIDYFISEFRLPRKIFSRILIGADDHIFYPIGSNGKEKPFTAIHYGKYIPLHGMPYIIKAAKELENANVRFQLIGAGGEYESSMRLAKDLDLKNIEFIEFLDQKELTHYIDNADVCLGIFGDTEKARRVVPNKVYEAMAMKKPLITGDSPAAAEILINNENCVLCEMKNPRAIADAILTLMNNEDLRKKIADEAYVTYQSYCSPSSLAKELKNKLQLFHESSL